MDYIYTVYQTGFLNQKFKYFKTVEKAKTHLDKQIQEYKNLYKKSLNIQVSDETLENFTVHLFTNFGYQSDLKSVNTWFQIRKEEVN